MEVRFSIDLTLTPLKGDMVYNSQDNSFDFEPVRDEQLIERVGTSGMTSVTIDMLQIEIGIEKSVALFVWGYQPQISWKITELPHIDPEPGGIKVALFDEDLPSFERGISIGYTEVNEWPTAFDPRSGWFCIGNPETDDSSKCIEFATNTVAVIKGDALMAVWLHPEFR
jgi:hypothetical protein